MKSRAYTRSCSLKAENRPPTSIDGVKAETCATFTSLSTEICSRLFRNLSATKSGKSVAKSRTKSLCIQLGSRINLLCSATSIRPSLSFLEFDQLACCAPIAPESAHIYGIRCARLTQNCEIYSRSSFVVPSTPRASGGYGSALNGSKSLDYRFFKIQKSKRNYSLSIVFNHQKTPWNLVLGPLGEMTAPGYNRQ